MKKILFSILSAFMVSTMASAQYLNVKMDDGTYRSFKTSSKTEVSFGSKQGPDPTESAQTVTVNGHTVTVKLAENTPASEVMVCAYIEGESVKVGAFSRLNLGLECVMDGEAVTPAVSNGYHTIALSKSNITNDVVVTVGYITVSFDLNNSNIADNFKDKPADITKMGYNSTIARTYASAERHGFHGWYKDKECTKAWNFSTGVTKSMTLYAKWAEDPTGTQINGYDFVKLGGYYWATKNVGEVKDQFGDNMYIAYDATYGYYYNQANAIKVAATWNYGSDVVRTWSLPSEAQWQALIDNCDWEWKTDYDYNGTKMNGMLFKGRADNYESGHSIFLPAAGIYYDNYGVGGQGDHGFYWSADSERWLNFINGYRGMHNDDDPSDGMAVRPVSE